MHFELGDVVITRVDELDRWAFPAAEMFPDVTRELFDCDHVDLSIATYVVATPDLTVLVDAGNGNDKHRPVLVAHDGFATDHLERLAVVVDPADVDVVVCTHLHPDHCGGLTRLVDDRWTPTFPNARHLIVRSELEWLAALADARPDDGPAADLARTYDDSVRPVLDAGLVDVVDAPVEIAPGVTAVPTPGHTAGHVVVEVERGGRLAVISGDVIHHPLQLRDLDLAQSGDADPAAAAASRRALVERVVTRRALLLPAHFAAGRVLAEDGRLRHEAAGSHS